MTKENREEVEQGDREEGFGRELSLTWRDTVPPNNEIVSGEWWGDNAEPQVSVEKQAAERLEIKVGDTLTFNIGGEVFTVPVTSLREADWGSLQPNFYMIFNTSTLADFLQPI